LIPVAAALALVAPSVAAETRPKSGGSVVVPLFEQPLAIGEPWRATRAIDQTIARATGEGLYRDGRPALADGEPNLVDPLTARVRVRTGSSAAEVAGAIERARSRPELTALVGALRGARLTPDGAIELALAQPLTAAQLVALLGAPQLTVRERGPFLLKATGGELRLDASPTYWAGRPYLDHVIFRTFTSRAEAVSAFELGSVQISLAGATLFGGKSTRAVAADGPEAELVFLAGAVDGLRPAIDTEAVRRFAARGPASAIAPHRPSPVALRAAFAVQKIVYDRSRFEDEAIAQKLQAQLAQAGLSVSIEAVPPGDPERRIASHERILAVVSCAPPVLEEPLASAWVKQCAGDALPLIRRGLRAHHGPELRALRLDEAGRLRFEDAFFARARAAASARP
jgi:hypothetical protein